MPRARRWTACLFGAAVMLASAAARSEDAQPYEAAAQAQPAAPAAAPDLSGAWSGSWSSYRNRHNGPMTAQFSRIDDAHYQVHFHGRFWKLIPFNYNVVLTVTGVDNGRVLLSGSHRLGPVLGTFSYNAWATDTQFVAGYCSEKDQGQFSMVRTCRCQ